MRLCPIAIFAAVSGLTGCAFHGAMTANSFTSPGSHAQVLPHTAVIYCHWNGSICEPPLTIYQGHFSGHVDAFGNVSFDPPDGLPPR